MKALKILTIVLISIVFMTAAGYGVVSCYYGDKFLCGTYINDHDTNAMSIDKANDYLVDSYLPGVDFKNVTLMFEGRDGSVETIKGSDFGLNADMTEGLDKIMSSQKPYEWLVYALYPLKYDLSPNVTYDKDILREKIEGLECVNDPKEQKDVLVEIRKDKSGYYLYDDILDELNTSRIFDKVCTALDDLDTAVVEIDLSDCYIKHDIPEEYSEVASLYEKIDKVKNSCISYEDAPIKYRLDGKTAVDWLETGSDGLPVLDESGNLVFDDEKMEGYLDHLAKAFNSSGGVFEWKKKNGEFVTLKNTMQGFEVDKEAETEKIKENMLRGGRLTRTPVYSKEGRGRGKDIIGKTYIEVDMSAQKLYYYVNGQLSMESDVVTGNLARGNGTPAKLCDVYFKQRNRTLRGPNYATFVNYWMAVSGHIGIHDATWRSKFGGEIYKTAGSHGCVNVPKSFAADLYEVVEVGTPCIMYY